MCMCPGRNKKCWRRDINMDLDRIKNVFHADVIVTDRKSVV